MQPNRKKPAACMWELVRANIWPFLGAMVSTVMIVLIGFMTPILLAETIDSVLGTAPSTLPAWLLQPIEALGGREFLRQNLWVLGAVPRGAQPDQRRVHLLQGTAERRCKRKTSP